LSLHLTRSAANKLCLKTNNEGASEALYYVLGLYNELLDRYGL